MPEVTIDVEMFSDYFATWSHVFAGPNLSWIQDDRQIFGDFFIGLQASSTNCWDTQIPPNSVITAATMEYTPYNTNLNPAPFSATMNTPDRFNADFQQQDPLQLPFVAFEGWRRDAWSNQEIAVVSTTFTFMAQPIGFDVGNRAWAMNFVEVPTSSIGQNVNLAQKITPVPGNTEVLFISYQMRRFGNPTGNIIIHIQGVTTDRGVTIPDGVDITNGVSIPVAASTLSNTSLNGVTFFFTTNPVLVAGQDYFLVIEVEYTPDFTNFISVGHLNQFLSDGQLYHYGDGLALDWQNYPGQIDLQFATGQGGPFGEGGTNILWDVGTQTIGVTETSPDISALIQEQVSAPGYTIDSGIIINLGLVTDPTQGRIMSANSHLTQPGPILRITYGDPVPEGEGKADSYRFHDKLTDEIYREDDEIIMIGRGLVDVFNRIH